MAITSRCKFPHDLNFAVKQLEVEIGNRLIANQELLKSTEALLPGMDALVDEGNALLDALMSKNGAGTPTASDLVTSADVATQYGLLPDKPTIEDEEKFVANANVLLFDTIVYLSGALSDNPKDATNIDILRRLYFALGKDLQKVEEVLAVDSFTGNITVDSNIVTNIASEKRLFVGMPIMGSSIPIGTKIETINSKTQITLTQNATSTIENNILVIENYRRTAFVHDQLVLKKVPYKSKNKKYTLDEIRVLLKEDQLMQKDIAYLSDSSAIVLLKSYLYHQQNFSVEGDQSKAETLKKSKIPEYELISNVFHIDGVDTSTNAITRYRTLGYTGDELNSIITGEDFYTANKITVINKVDSLHAEAKTLINKIDFLLSRKDLAAISLPPYYESLRKGLDTLMINHEGLLTMLKFEVSKFLKRDILVKLREKHTDEKIKYLLERRQDVMGFWFDPPDDRFLSELARSLTAAAPNTTYISNKFINYPQYSKYDQYSALSMYATLLNAQKVLEGDITVNALQKAKGYLYHYITSTPVQAPPTVNANVPAGSILRGQPSAASPAPILVERFDVFKTMKFDLRLSTLLGSFTDLYDIYPRSVVEALIEVITAVTKLFTKVFKAIDSIIIQAEKTLFAMKKRLDSWLSKHLSLTGQGDFNSSLLKCSVNWDIGVSTDLLDMLFDYLMKFVGLVAAFMSKMKLWINDMLTKVICMPVGILNNLLGKLESALPSACKIPRLDLGAKLNTSLEGLLNVSTAKSIVLQACGNDLARLKMSITAAPDRLGQFKGSALCESSSTAGFMNASMLNINAGVAL